MSDTGRFLQDDGLAGRFLQDGGLAGCFLQDDGLAGRLTAQQIFVGEKGRNRLGVLERSRIDHVAELVDVMCLHIEIGRAHV